MKFHVEHINNPQGSEHNAIVEYASAENVIRYFLPRMPAGAYLIHELPENYYGTPVRSTPAHVRATVAETVLNDADTLTESELASDI